MAEKKERLLTPVGFAKWAFVHKPKPAFDENQKPKFQIDVYFDQSDPAWKAWASDLMAKVNALPSKTDRATGEKVKHKSPIKPELDKDDLKTGRYYVTFKTGEQFKPGVFDKYGKPFPDNEAIGNESKVKVNYSTAEYEGFGGGITLYLNAVQVLELVPYSKQTAEGYGFDVDKSEPPASNPPAPSEDDLPWGND